jgi:hypothetical protein
MSESAGPGRHQPYGVPHNREAAAAYNREAEGAFEAVKRRALRSTSAS